MAQGQQPQLPERRSTTWKVLHICVSCAVLAVAYYWAGPVVCLFLIIVSNKLGWDMFQTGGRNGQRVAALLANHDLLPAPVRHKHCEDVEDDFVRVGVCSMQGWRRTMEDAHTARLSLSPAFPSLRFFGVYDGHCGDVVAKWAAEHLPRHIEEAPLFVAGRWGEGMQQGFLRADEALKELLAPLLPNPPLRPGGSTAVSVLLTPPSGQTPPAVYCANVGDSRAVLCRAGGALPLSEDHKPVSPGEAERIQRAGGIVRMNRVMGQLAMSRALGDFQFKTSPLPAEQQMVTALPEVRYAPLSPEDEFLVLACDGIWDCRSSEDVVSFVRQRLAPPAEGSSSQRPLAPPKLSAICAQLFDAMVSKSPRGIGCDNMSMIIVQFKTRPAAAP
eukprot:TRINITY_DN5058_c0_g1_i1.p2 TRINITY_DN5058_c0_g1~~TRINITY_DN5058_c0_g1_i1.p2  ORF type:complete len:387 (+),score=125.21 TRINITY_DN5058_c0_g1_i1:87-1247(+)